MLNEEGERTLLDLATGLGDQMLGQSRLRQPDRGAQGQHGLTKGKARSQ